MEIYNKITSFLKNNNINLFETLNSYIPIPQQVHKSHNLQQSKRSRQTKRTHQTQLDKYSNINRYNFIINYKKCIKENLLITIPILDNYFPFSVINKYWTNIQTINILDIQTTQTYQIPNIIISDDEVLSAYQMFACDKKFDYNNIFVNDRTGQDRTGQDRTGQDRTGQDRIGQDRTGQDRTKTKSLPIMICYL
jgi:hypothetical protein